MATLSNALSHVHYRTHSCTFLRTFGLYFRFDQALELACPSETDVEPEMCLIFELFLLRGQKSPVDKACELQPNANTCFCQLSSVLTVLLYSLNTTNIQLQAKLVGSTARISGHGLGRISIGGF